MTDAMRDIRSMTREALADAFAADGEKPFRAHQVFQWIHEKHVTDFADMRNLPKTLRASLSARYTLQAPETLRVARSASDGCAKYLFAFPDGECVESVCMPYRFGNTVCVSSQAGCAMGCAFCASAAGGLRRSLRASEMLAQVYAIADDIKDGVSHVVVMGMGEPLENYDNLCRFVTLLSDKNGMGMSRRHITVSTCGIVPKIRVLAHDLPQINLAVSLHAPTQALRETLMPVARAYPLPELMAACRDYGVQTGRQVTFEYALMRGVNDAPEHAAALARLLPDISRTVNLIPVNPAGTGRFTGPKRTDVLKFKKNLEKMGIHVTIRREMGRDIDGACGQLVRRHREEIVC